MYQSGPWIEEAVNSVLQQSFLPKRILVIDDGSTDDGPAQVRRIAAHSTVPIVLKSQPNAGQAAARNRGLSEVTETYVAFLDADDVWMRGKLETQVLLLQSSGCVAATCGYTLGTSQESTSHALGFWWTSADIHAWSLAFGAGPALMSTLLVETEIAHKLNGFREDMSIFADLDFSIRLQALGEVACADAGLVWYRQHDQQIHRNSDVLLTEAAYFAGHHLNSQETKTLLRNLHYLQLLRKLRTPQSIASRSALIARSLTDAPGMAAFMFRRSQRRRQQRVTVANT